MITQRGFTVAFAGVLFLTSGFSFMNFYLTLLGVYLFVGLVVTLPLFAMTANLSGIEVDRRIDKTKVFSGDFLRVRVTIRNTSRRHFDFIEVWDQYPETWILAIGENFMASRIEPGSSIVFSYILQVRMRGRYYLGPTEVVMRDRLGLHYYKRVVKAKTEILVYPTWKDVRRLETIGKQRQLGLMFGAHKTKVVGMGTEFSGFREYVPGDPFRLIDWATTAKKGDIVVKQYEEEKNVQIICMVDTSGSMGNGYPESTKLEYGIRAALLLTYMGLERKDFVGVCIFSDLVHAYVRPSTRQNHMYEVLDALAMAEPSGWSDYETAVSHVTRLTKKRSLFFFLTDLEESPAPLLSAMKAVVANGHNAVVISPFGPWFEAPVGQFGPVEKVLSEAVSEELWERRGKISRALARFGIPVINVGPEDFLPTIIRQYNMAKQRGVALH
ncbi:MAG: hypothetical protein C4K47_06640 [Candidatus Thorarchaeota archaeon]|nr:MAG: hypothetical protein C4K47_06640 [Candidatus Thorarchaeota archaeon]